MQVHGSSPCKIMSEITQNLPMLSGTEPFFLFPENFIPWQKTNNFFLIGEQSLCLSVAGNCYKSVMSRLFSDNIWDVASQRHPLGRGTSKEVSVKRRDSRKLYEYISIGICLGVSQNVDYVMMKNDFFHVTARNQNIVVGGIFQVLKLTSLSCLLLNGNSISCKRKFTFVWGLEQSQFQTTF